MTALVYLEESTLENGCVRLVPGSHQRPFRQPRRLSGSFDQSPLYYRALPVPMPRGGVLLFNDCCYHGAGPNGSADLQLVLVLFMPSKLAKEKGRIPRSRGRIFYPDSLPQR